MRRKGVRMMDKLLIYGFLDVIMNCKCLSLYEIYDNSHFMTNDFTLRLCMSVLLPLSTMTFTSVKIKKQAMTTYLLYCL